MATVEQTVAALRIFGDELVPEELTRLLGRAPTKSRRKGEEIIGKTTGNIRVAKTGAWHVSASDRTPGDLDSQISEILNSLTSDLTVWRGISERFQIDLFCGLFMKGSNEGITLSAASLAALGSRGIEIGLDIYGELRDA